LYRLFCDTRTRYRAGIKQYGLSDQVRRFAELEQIYGFFKERGNYVAARDTLVIAAKESGGYFTKRDEPEDALALLVELAEILKIPVTQLPPPDALVTKHKRRA
jgi:hypothetical protein